MKHTQWEQLYKDSQQLKKPARISALISPTDVEAIKALLLEVIQAYIEKGELHLGLKTYINSELRNDYNDRLLSHPPKNNDTLESWSSQVFGEEKFGLIFNYLEEFSNDFAEKAAEVVRPFIALAGLPLEGISFLFFMGNYGFTPFGIHKDAIGEDGVLFHLGPANKLFYTWDDPEHNAIQHHSKVFHDVKEKLPEAQCYELKAGDAQFIPHAVYHIADTPEFSVSFVMDYVSPPMDQFENRLLKEAGAENSIGQNSYVAPINAENPRNQWKQLLNQQSLQQKIEIAFERKVLALKSNGGILRKSNLRRSFQLPNGSFSIKGKAIFPLFVEKINEEKDLIFARGHRLVKPHHSNLSKLVEKINSGKNVKFETIKAYLEPAWDLIEIYGFIGELINVEAIAIVD